MAKRLERKGDLHDSSHPGNFDHFHHNWKLGPHVQKGRRPRALTARPRVPQILHVPVQHFCRSCFRHDGILLVTGMRALLPMWLVLLKYSAAVSVCLTFCVVVVFLGPRMGYKPLFAHEQLCLHAVGPLLAVFSFLTSPFTPEMKSSDSIIAVIPTLLYGIGYAGNILKNGIGEGENTNDWYGFAVGGVKFIPVVFAIILAVTWGMAAGMLALRGVINH